ncbi:MAG TPA: hypothetical protein VK536_01805 [Candidatus Limnocylindrales bacterium]|nr:hypothetical protein [Candidatus Limnocylindrales bacterium]
MEEFVSALLDVIDLLDNPNVSLSMGIAKRTLLSTNGFLMGDKEPITQKDITKWVSLRDDYLVAVHEKRIPYALSIETILFASTFELLNRCYTSKNQFALSEMISKRWRI